MNRSPTLGSRLALACLRAAGWTPLLAPPPGPRFIAPFAPHTSNMDFWIGVLWKWATRSPAHFVIKHTLFVFPFGVFLRAVGGIPLDRGRRGGNFVEAVADVVRQADEMVLLVSPEGTRKRSDYWRTGFYYMALSAGVPLGITVIDWGRKRAGVVGYVTPSGDIEADFAKIRAFLEGVEGKYPDQATPAYARPAETGDDPNRTLTKL